MELKTILTSHAIRFFADSGEMRVPRSPVPLIDGIREKYGFVQVPQTVAELDFKNGVSFLRGYFKGKIIDKLQIYENGLLCEAAEDNSLTDDFISDLFAWVQEHHNLPVKETEVRAYLSQMVVISNVDVARTFSGINAIGPLFAKAIKSYGQTVQGYRLSGLRMHYDAMETPVPRSPEFSFERRAGEKYSTNEFFTSAPLRTSDHLKVLEALEKAFG